MCDVTPTDPHSFVRASEKQASQATRPLSETWRPPLTASPPLDFSLSTSLVLLLWVEVSRICPLQPRGHALPRQQEQTDGGVRLPRRAWVFLRS